MNEPTRIRWGILGPGTIAKDFFAGALQCANGKVVAIGARNPAKSGLAEDFPGARIVDGYDALIDDPEIDAVYIATVHPLHAEWAIKAAERASTCSARSRWVCRQRRRTPCSRPPARRAPSWPKPTCIGFTR